MKIAIIAHSLSSNIGDRYQGTGVMRMLSILHPGVQFDFINSHPFNNGAASQVLSWVGQGEFTVLDPDQVDWDSYDVGILATGSISGDSIHCRWSESLLKSKRTRKLFIWGGFHDITDFDTDNAENAPLRRIFHDRRVHFFSRGWIELAVYNFITRSGRGVCGGDPVLLNDFSSLQRLLNVYRNPLLVISGHVFSDNDKEELSVLSEIAEEFPKICSVEGVEDKRLSASLKSGVQLANTLDDYAALVERSSIVVTQRLHGVALAKAVSPGLPVLCWLPRRNCFSHIKFRSVVETAAGFGQPIAHYYDQPDASQIRKALSDPNSFMNRDHEVNFARYCRLTNLTLDCIGRGICDLL